MSYKSFREYLEESTKIPNDFTVSISGVDYNIKGSIMLDSQGEI